MITLAALSAALGLPCPGSPDLVLNAVAPLESAGPRDLVGLFEPRWRGSAQATHGAVALTTPTLRHHLPSSTLALVHEDARALWGKALRLIYPGPSLQPPPVGIHPSAVVDPTARVSPAACIGPLVVIGPFCEIYDHVALYPGVVLGHGVSIGRGTHVHPRAMLLDDTQVGARVIIGPGAVLGAVGFGLDAQGLQPHVGRVRVENGATLGAQTCVDRATVGETIIGADAHLDNLVQVGHNATIGPGAVLCGQVGIAGGAHIEGGVVLGGQAGVAGHVTVASGVRVAAQSGVTRPLTHPGEFSGHPAEPNHKRLRREAWWRREADRALEERAPEKTP
ncbi:MAG: UDP-3-O-(3-hydroxymyristoyl)glucosamine N-acyltransferase [Bradymonadia bacterium]